MRRATYIKICKVGIIVMSAIAIYSTVMSTFPEEDVDDVNIDPKVLQYLKPKPPRKNDKKVIPTLRPRKKEVKFKEVKENERVKVFGNVKKITGKDINRAFIPGQYRVLGYSSDISLLSAVIGNSSDQTWDYTSIQGWEHVKYVNSSFSCCFLYQSGIVTSTNTTSQISWKHDKHARIVAKQYVCPNPRTQNDDLPIGVTIAGTKSHGCNRNVSWYLRPHYSRAHKKIVTCTKVVHSNVSENDVLSWFEVHRKLGMEKVFVYTYDMAPNVAKILRHYQDAGIAKLIPFRLPKYYKGKQITEIGSQFVKEWNIEQALINDCFERSKGYKYVVVLDINQYLIPYKVPSWTQLFNLLYKLNKPAAGFAFNVNLHITSWAVGNRTSKFTAGRYFNHTFPQDRNVKHVTQPEAVSGLSIYAFTPLRGFREFRAPVSQAVVHHFRSCKKSNDWEDDVDATCQNMGNYYEDKYVAKILAPLENKIIKLKSSILNKA